MFVTRKILSTFLIPAATALAIGLPMPSVAYAQASEASYSTVWERFSAFDENSEVKVDHQPLDEFLRQTVFPVGRSKSKLGTQARQDTFTGSRVRRSSSAAPSKFEGNRVMFHAFTQDHNDFLLGYKAGLESLSVRRPLAELNKNEQLAFWLNLYNVTVMDKLADEYPISKLKSLRESKKQTTFWEQKTITVEGVSLSLIDIEQILFNNWDDPRVMYGLYQGSIGGPSLPNVAFTADNVWILLNNNALEFVNSNRGVRMKGTRAEISKMYNWAGAAFGNSDAAIITHIQQYADAFHSDISGLSTVKAKYYDWNIADLVGGNLHKGQHIQLGGVLTAGGKDTRSGGPNAVGGEEDVQFVDVFRLYDHVLDKTPAGPLTILPQQAVDFITEVKIRNDIPNRTPVVTVIDCELETCELIDLPDNEPTEDPQQDPQPLPFVIVD